MKYILPLTIWMTGINFTASGQEIDILFIEHYEPAYVLRAISKHKEGTGISGKLEENFMPSRDLTFVQPPDNGTYTSKGVKTIKIWSATDPVLLFELQMDSAGGIIRQGIITRKYFRTKRTFTQGDTVTAEVTTYFADGKVVRTDSLAFMNNRYTDGDSDIVKSTTHYVVSRSGKLLNEEHAYYNQKYLNKKTECPGLYKTWTGSVRYAPDRKTVLLRKRLRTNYKDDEMYLFSSRTGGSMQYFKDSTYIGSTNLEGGQSCYLNERCFVEPQCEDIFPRPLPCGNASRRHNRRSYVAPDAKSYQYSRNENGLKDTLYFMNDHSEMEAIAYFEYEYYE